MALGAKSPRRVMFRAIESSSWRCSHQSVQLMKCLKIAWAFTNCCGFLEKICEIIDPRIIFYYGNHDEEKEAVSILLDQENHHVAAGKWAASPLLLSLACNALRRRLKIAQQCRTSTLMPSQSKKHFQHCRADQKKHFQPYQSIAHTAPLIWCMMTYD